MFTLYTGQSTYVYTHMRIYTRMYVYRHRQMERQEADRRSPRFHCAAEAWCTPARACAAQALKPQRPPPAAARARGRAHLSPVGGLTYRAGGRGGARRPPPGLPPPRAAAGPRPRRRAAGRRPPRAAIPPPAARAAPRPAGPGPAARRAGSAGAGTAPAAPHSLPRPAPHSAPGSPRPRPVARPASAPCGLEAAPHSARAGNAHARRSTIRAHARLPPPAPLLPLLAGTAWLFQPLLILPPLLPGTAGRALQRLHLKRFIDWGRLA